MTETTNIKDFATCLCCIDGRIQAYVIDHLTSHFPFKWIDMINEPGVHNLINQAALEDPVFKWLCRKIEISFEAHASEDLFLVAHEDCAAHSVDKKQHYEDLRQAKDKLSAAMSLDPRRITLLYVALNGHIDLI